MIFELRVSLHPREGGWLSLFIRTNSSFSRGTMPQFVQRVANGIDNQQVFTLCLAIKIQIPLAVLQNYRLRATKKLPTLTIRYATSDAIVSGIVRNAWDDIRLGSENNCVGDRVLKLYSILETNRKRWPLLPGMSKFLVGLTRIPREQSGPGIKQSSGFWPKLEKKSIFSWPLHYSFSCPRAEPLGWKSDHLAQWL